MVVIKKPIWSTEVVGLDGKGVIIHNYADGTNSGPLPIDRSGIHFIPSNTYKRKIRVDPNDPMSKFLEELDEDLG